MTTKNNHQVCRLTWLASGWWQLEPPAFGQEGQLQCHPVRWFLTRNLAVAEARQLGWEIDEDMDNPA